MRPYRTGYSQDCAYLRWGRPQKNMFRIIVTSIDKWAHRTKRYKIEQLWISTAFCWSNPQDKIRYRDKFIENFSFTWKNLTSTQLPLSLWLRRGITKGTKSARDCRSKSCIISSTLGSSNKRHLLAHPHLSSQTHRVQPQPHGLPLTRKT